MVVTSVVVVIVVFFFVVTFVAVAHFMDRAAHEGALMKRTECFERRHPESVGSAL